MTDYSIRAAGIGKRYRKLDQAQVSLRSILPFARTERRDLWALRGLDLEVRAGETIGVLGRNGSGKSTLLQMLAGVSRPTEGRVEVIGRIAPLLSVGVGFNPELSGRENVRINGLMLGMTPDSVRERLADVVRFAELEDFIDTPVKFYSSGMFTRLGFSVAVHADPDVLLVDEVLAVGDVAFQVRCAERMAALQERGTTIVLVSHAIATVHALCPRVLVLDHGKPIFDGPTEEAIGAYQDVLSRAADVDVEEAARSGAGRKVEGGASISDVRLTADGRKVHFVPAGTPVCCSMRVEFDRDIDDPVFGINLLGSDGRGVYGIHTPIAMAHRSYRAGEVAEVEARFTAGLGTGTYRVLAVVSANDGRSVYATEPNGPSLYVNAPGNAYGVADLGGVVSVDGVDCIDDRSWRLGSA